jgi:hypothetical protein
MNLATIWAPRARRELGGGMTVGAQIVERLDEPVIWAPPTSCEQVL